MGSRRNVLDSQAIRDFEDMRLQHSNDPGRWPRYDVDLDEADEAVRRDLGVLLPDIVTSDLLDAASAPPGLGEDFTISNIVGGSWKTEAEKQRELASHGMDVSHVVRASMRGSYPDTVRALIESLANHGRKLLVVAETDTGLRISAYLPRPWYGGSSGRMAFELTLPPTHTPTVEVSASAECKGTMGKWSRGRSALQDVLTGADALLRGEAPSASPVQRRLWASLRPEGHLQWAWLALIATCWLALVVVASISAAEGSGSALGALVTMAVMLPVFGSVYLWTKARYL